MGVVKISIIGVGKVGSALAFALVTKGLCEQLVLVGRTRASTLGDAHDLMHASAFVRPLNVIAGTIADSRRSDIIIFTVSAPMADTSSRLSVARQNAKLYRRLIPKIAKLSPKAILIVVANPVDLMTYVTLQASSFPPSRVIGTGTLLDTARFRALLSQHSGINVFDLRAYILGEHGDSQFPALSVASAGGMRFDEHDATVLGCFKAARQGGYQVVRHKGYTNYAIALATTLIVETIAGDLRAVAPVSVLIDGFLGVRDVCLSMPCVLGRSGVTRVLPVELNEREASAFQSSAALLRNVIDDLKLPGQRRLRWR
jgi:L-lactate dehydrogenase